MTADEIRELFKNSTNEYLLLAEIAAQLAELNQQLREGRIDIGIVSGGPGSIG